MLKVSIDAWNVAEGEQEERGLEGGTGGDMNRLQSAKEKWTAGGEICTGRCVRVLWLCVHVSVYCCLFTCLLKTNMPEDLHKHHLQK